MIKLNQLGKLQEVKLKFWEFVFSVGAFVIWRYVREPEMSTKFILCLQ